jgi:hypothetical protein
MLKSEGECDTAAPCNCCEPTTQGERDAPHLLPFVVGFAIKNRHNTNNKNNNKKKKENGKEVYLFE